MRPSGTILLGVFFACMAWLYQGYTFGHGNHGQEIPPILALIDSTLYQNDFAVQDFLSPGPRYVYYHLVAWLSSSFNIGVDLALLFLKMASQVSFYIAITFIFRATMEVIRPGDFEWSNKNILLSGLFAAACTLPLLSWGSSIFYPHAIPSAHAIPSTLAMAIAVWSLFFAVKQQWVLAFVFSAAAIPFQFLVGLFSGLVLLPALLAAAVRNRSLMLLGTPLIIFLAPAVGIYVATVASQQSVPVSFNFLEVFGIFRVPHHWLPSSGRWFHWVSDALLLLSALIAAILIWRANPRYRIFVLVPVGMTLIATTGVALNYIFVEVLPVTFIGKLQFQRIMPFAHLAVYLLVISVLFLFYWNPPRISSRRERMWSLASIGLALQSLLIPMWIAAGGSGFLLAVTVLFIGGLVLFSLGGRSARVVLFSSAFGLLVFVNSPVAERFPEPVGKVISARFQPLDDEQWSGKEISEWLRQNSPIDTLIIIPPDWSAVSDLLAMHSRRSVFFSFKNVPYSNHGVWKWSERAEELLGVAVGSSISKRDLREIWATRSNEEVISIGERNGACFLVDRMNDRSGLDLELIVTAWVKSNEAWGLWKFGECNET